MTEILLIFYWSCEVTSSQNLSLVCGAHVNRHETLVFAADEIILNL